MIISDKKRITSVRIRTNQFVTLGLSQGHQRRKRRPEVQVRIVRACSLKRGFIWYRHLVLVAKHRVVFAYDDDWINHIDGLPHPVIITIDINTQQANLIPEASIK